MIEPYLYSCIFRLLKKLISVQDFLHPHSLFIYILSHTCEKILSLQLLIFLLHLLNWCRGHTHPCYLTSNNVEPKAKQNTMGPAKSVSFMMLPSAAFNGCNTVRVFCQIWSKLIPSSSDKTTVFYWFVNSERTSMYMVMGQLYQSKGP